MKKITVLQSFRAIFIILICIEHLALKNKISFLGAGGEGVSFFIILSGFLTGYIYKNRDIDCSLKNIKKFVFKKLNKFYPLHLTALTLSMLLQLLYLTKNHLITIKTIVEYISKFTLNALFLQVYVPIEGWYMNNINGVCWFLSTIMFCYAFSLFGVKLADIAKRKNRSFVLFLTVFILFLAISFLFTNTKISTFMLYVFPPVRFLEYFMAIIIGYNFNKDFKFTNNQNIINIMEIVVVLLWLLNHTLIKTNLIVTYQYFQRANTFIITLLIIYVFSHEKGFVSKLMDNSLLIIIGDLSFFIYIMHQVIIQYSTTLFGWNNIGAIVSVVAIIIYAFIISKYNKA